MAQITWDETLPSNASSANTADNEFRSMLTNIATGLGESMFWPGSAVSQGFSTASSGEMRPSSARVSTVSLLATSWGGKPDGFLSLITDENKLVHIGSTWSGQVAHSATLHYSGGIDNAPFQTHWVLQEGTTQTSDGSDTVTFTTAYNGVPFVKIGPGQLAREWNWQLRNLTATGFIIDKLFGGSGGATTPTLFWMSEGTISGI